MIRKFNRRATLKSILAFSTLASLPLRRVHAQNWPTKTLKLVVGGAAGSVPDSLARVVADALTKKLGQTVIVENRAGAGGIVAMQGVAGSPPDGYTIGLATISQLVFNSYLFLKLPYNPTRDLAPISTLAGSASLLVAHPSIAAGNLPELVALSKKEPGKFLLGIPQNGAPPHIAALLLMRETGLSATIVPFKTGPEALTSAIRGDIQLVIDGPTLLAPQVDSNAVKAIVVTGPQRFEVLKDVPTVNDVGFPKATSESWMGIVAPAGTPAEIVEELSRQSRSLLADDDYVRKLRHLSFVPRSATPREFSDLIVGEHERWSPILEAARLRAD
jgi:tripartite-type tricarboxylate transporter receptor subunit TctC